MSEFDNLVVLDANFLLTPIQFKVDYLEEIDFQLEGRTKFLIYSHVLEELQSKADRFAQQQKSARFEGQLKAGKAYLEQNKSGYTIYWSDEIKKKGEPVDDFLLRKVAELKQDYKRVYLATNDRTLRKRARNLVSVICIRQNQTITIY